ncbi:MAG: porin [Gemmatimonas sp.]|nr:porin [Gemmatimonas sp.]
MNLSTFRSAVLLLCALPALATAQTAAPRDSARRPLDFTSKGLVFSGSDGFSYLALRFRIQQWAVFSKDDGADGLSSATMAIRRARFRFESVAWDPRFKVNVQLSFSRGDMDFENSGFPNVLRDATVSFQATPNLVIMGGQTKLPGNRQRVISSGEQQFPDRSIVNGAFTIDRDMGLWATYTRGRRTRPVILSAAVTSGEGGAIQTGNPGLSYTGRVELQPLGAFTGGGDNFEGDLVREPAPRLALGVTLNHNEQGERAGGQLGRFLYEPRDMDVLLADLLFKYRGFATAVEFGQRRAADPVTTSGALTRTILTGSGTNVQASYYFPRGFEIGARWSTVDPHRDVRGAFERQRQHSLVLTRYFQGHRVKWQNEAIRDEFRNGVTGATRGGWTARSSFEFGI